MGVLQDSKTGPTTTIEGGAGGTMSAMKVAREFMNTKNDVPTTTTTMSPNEVAEKETTDLFDGVLGEYELNEIPSLFNMDPEQMASELDAFDFASSSSSITSSASSTPSLAASVQREKQKQLQKYPNLLPTVKPIMACPPLPSAEIALKPRSRNSSNKRAAPAMTVSEDEASSPKSMRLTRSISSASSTSSKESSLTEIPLSGQHGQQVIAPRPSTSSGISTIPAATYTSADDLLDGLPPVDTSTAHIKALTGTKGAAICFDIIHASKKDEALAALPNLADMSPEEKAKFSRDRNRLHARNTRIRKKAFVDELKRTLNALVAQRDAAHQQKLRQEKVDEEHRIVRFGVVDEFLRLRGRRETNVGLWNAILEPDATLQLPSSCCINGNGASLKKTFFGADEVIQACHEDKLITTLGESLEVQCSRDSLLMESTTAVVDWTVTSTTKKNISIRGTCRATFNPVSNKIHSVKVYYDSGPLLRM